MAAKLNGEWSKAYKCVPQDNIISHRYAKSKPFIPSYEQGNCSANMNLLLGWEYARIWEKEHASYLEARKQSEKARLPKRDSSKLKLRKQKKRVSGPLGKQVRTAKSKPGRKPASDGGRLAAGGGNYGASKKDEDALNFAYGDICTGNVAPPAEDSVGEIDTGALECEDNAQQAELKLVKNEMKQDLPKTYIDPQQYLGGISIEQNDLQQLCEATSPE